MKSITIDTVNYLELKADESGKINCPFCGEDHTHGKKGGDGHRVAHCSRPIENPVMLDGKSHYVKNGYIVKF